MSNPPPPPSTLTVPDLGSAVADGELYFSIIETFRDCPVGVRLLRLYA